MSIARGMLAEVFGFEAFRPGQEAVIEALPAWRNMLTVMQTGSGKSLCFQVPALVRAGLTVVVSPLVALMQDAGSGAQARRRRGRGDPFGQRARAERGGVATCCVGRGARALHGPGAADDRAHGRFDGTCRYAVSYRDLEAMMTERGVAVDHSTIYRWVQRFAPEMEKRLRWQWRRPQSVSWRIDETYIKVRGKWAYLYRALDKLGNTIDFYPSATRNTK